MKSNNMFYVFATLIFAVHVSFAQNDTLSLYYAIGSAKMSFSQERNVLDKFEELVESEKYDIQIIGWTDSIGSESKNILLSKERAKNVHDFIISKIGLNCCNSIKCNGYGEMASMEMEKEKRMVQIIFTRHSMPIVDNSILASIDVGQSKVLSNLVFEPGKHYLKKESIPFLFELFEAFRLNENLKAVLEGHVWDFYVGDTEEELKDAQLLSERRAKNIYDFLVRKGVSAERLSYVGYGIEKPLPLSNQSPSLNRRVEIRILNK